MARSRRRTSRRTATQRAASLIALALPAPVQRVADTRIGSLLMLVGFPVMIVFGLLNVTWVDGYPTFTFNRNRATELRNAASQHINELEHQAALQNWGQTADLLHAVQGPNHTHRAPAFPSTLPQVASQASDWQQQQHYQRQVYEQQLRQQQQQQQQFPYQQSQPTSQPWQGNSTQSSSQGNVPSIYGQYGQGQYAQGQYAQGQYGQTLTQPYGYNTPQYYNGYGLPSANNGQQPYTNQSGQLGRY